MNGSIQKLKKHSKLHPALLKLLHETGLEYVRHKNSTTYHRSQKFWSEKFRKSKELLLINSLLKCHKTALVLPTHLLQKIASKFKLLENLHIGSEALLESIIGFEISGYTPPQIFTRVQTIMSAGILQRWLILSRSKAAGQFSQNLHQLSKPRIPDMSGSMLVIFVFLFSGEAFSLMAFGLENSQKIYLNIFLLLRCVWSRLLLNIS